MSDIEFVDGLIVREPGAAAPEFVKARLSIKVADLGVWLRAKHKAGEEWVNADVKVSKNGKWYASVSTYKPKEKDETPKGKPADMDDDDGIPF